MKLIRFALRSISNNTSNQLYRSTFSRTFLTKPFSGNNQNSNPAESADEFERRIFGNSSGHNSKSDAFYEKLDRLEKGSGSGGWNNANRGGGSSMFDGLDESFDTLSDGMDNKLKRAATYFEFDPEEIENDEYYAFRPDVSFKSGMTYDTKDLDLTKPGVRRLPKRYEFETTTEEVLKKADFRNVRFLANFITEAGIIIKRSKTGISAKAQRKVAREIKTARAFGLMPFTTMGTKPFKFGKTMEDLDEDFEYEPYDSRVSGDADPTAL